jgi:hypothetical protein
MLFSQCSAGWSSIMKIHITAITQLVCKDTGQEWLTLLTKSFREGKLLPTNKKGLLVS